MKFGECSFGNTRNGFWETVFEVIDRLGEDGIFYVVFFCACVKLLNNEKLMFLLFVIFDIDNRV